MTVEVREAPGIAVDGTTDHTENRVYLYPGKLHVATEPTVLTTVLGSCVALCLWDDTLRVGGANHYLLPEGDAGGGAAFRFAGGALRGLLAQLLALGVRKSDLKAKLFGGAAVIEVFRDSAQSLGGTNVRAAREFLLEHGIPLVAEDVEGHAGRKLVFHTDGGAAWVRQL